uniref:MCF.2 cell line derived transforming sequence n=1 Tax=Scophthalmus maximus TaxID=52904 RepID=A0A8D3CBG5_SCOMX
MCHITNMTSNIFSLLKASFPGNLHLVLVLRPTSFFHRTVTDIGFRFSQEDFMLKMPVVMLSSVTDLLRYISENQLTSEFGGTLDYCHSDWIVLRTAIESFAVTVKDIAQMLQGFGTELAETELPDKGKAIEYLLEAQTDKYRKLKDAIRSVSKEGRHLLSSLETSGKEDDSEWDVKLLAQLRDMESAFDGFFEKHHLKLHQYLQLLKYEQSFQEVRIPLSQHFLIMALVTQHVCCIETVSVLCRLSQEVVSRAQIIILHGHQLSASHHFAMALIMQRCNELRHHCDTLNAALKTRHSRLLHTHQLLLCLDQAHIWCDDGAYLLANQLVENFQSKEGAQTALRDIEKFLEEAPSILSSGPDVLAIEYEVGKTFEKHAAVQQMIQNRQACLRKLADKHVRPVQLVAPRPENPARSKSPLFSPKHGTVQTQTHTNTHTRKTPPPPLNMSQKCILSIMFIIPDNMYFITYTSLIFKRDILFGNMPDIYNFHSRTFLQDLEGCLEAPEGVAACFLKRKESFQMYECYCQNKPRSESLWRQFADCAFFHECQKKLEHKLGLDSYLLKPVQRLTKYQLLLKELLKYSTDCEGTSELEVALTAMLDLLKSVNDSMHQIAITGYEGDICELGRVLMQGSFSVWISHKRGPTRMKELARFKPMQRHLFLYERALLFCKRREEHGEGCDKTPSYSFKHCLKMTAVGITENVKGDVKKFEIWYSGREEVYGVQAPTVEVKMAWLNELRRILTNQQKMLRGL